MWTKFWRGQRAEMQDSSWGLECPRAQAVWFAHMASASAILACSSLSSLSFLFLFFHLGVLVNPGLTPSQ